ncbi:MAG: PQQ-binding-like beta-propeller repeat protein [Planctomycetota bacterium]
MNFQLFYRPLVFGFVFFNSVLLASCFCVAQTPPEVAVNWGHWRGPEANGVSRTATPPLEWSEDKNVVWKVPIEGQGNATPIVWGNQVFLLTAINTGKVEPSLPKPEDQPKRVFGIKHPNTYYQFVVICLDRRTGQEVWRDVATELVPHEGTHRDADFASASPTTDGERLVCWFGSAGLFCYDLDGERLWQRDLGKAYVGASLGEGCSPVLHDDRVVIVRDHARQSRIHVLNARSGETIWQKDRDEENAWATPRVLERNGSTQVITCGTNLIRSYDLEDGEIVWQCDGLTKNCIPCPVVEDDVVFCMTGYQGYSLLAISLDAKGDVSREDAIRWRAEDGTPYVPSPVLYDGRIYCAKSSQAILSCFNTEDGSVLFGPKRLPKLAGIYASLVGADGKVYVSGRYGQTLVLKRTDSMEILATNQLDDQFHASPALAGNQLFLRGRKSLYCLAE